MAITAQEAIASPSGKKIHTRKLALDLIEHMTHIWVLSFATPLTDSIRLAIGSASYVITNSALPCLDLRYQ